MIDATSPRSPVFIAPDGEIYVDRDGNSDKTLRRWRATFDPAFARRRTRIREWGGVFLLMGSITAGAAAGYSIGRAVSSAEVAGVFGAVLGAGAGNVVVIARLIWRTKLPKGQEAVVRVPREVLRAADQQSGSAQVWRWATAINAEESERETIGFETFIERASDSGRARLARRRYSERYADYRVVTAELRIPSREPAIPLERRSAAGTGDH